VGGKITCFLQHDKHRVFFNALLTSLAQLGVDDSHAFRNGDLLGNSLFFGSATAEVLSRNYGNNASWNLDYAHSPTPSSWQLRSATSTDGGDNNGGSGIFSLFSRGGDANQTSHRTILSGY
jgi:hypothetical protein